MEELKNCPFCGNVVELGEITNEDGSPYWYVFCPECGASVYGDEKRENVIARWNRRTEEKHDKIGKV